MHAITYTVNTGNERETFFINQILSYFAHRVSFLRDSIFISKKGNFIVHDMTFEVGGRNKDYKQIKDIEKSYIVSEDIELGYKNRIPLWLFGFLY